MPPQTYIDAETRLHDVRVYVDGLHGETHAAAVAAAERLRKASTLGRLNAELSTVQLHGTAVDVGPGPNKGSVFVTIRPEHGCHCVAAAGREGLPGLNSAFSLRVDGTPAAEDGPPPLRVSAEGRICLEEEALRCSVKATPTKHTSPFIPSLQLGLGMGGLLAARPFRTEGQGHLVLTDLLGRHTLKLGATSRDLRPQKDELSTFMELPLQSSKTSLSYHFLKESEVSSTSTTSRVSFFTELAGLLGDVKLARCEASWMRTGEALGGQWQLSSAVGMAKALQHSTLPLEERFYLGGAFGSLQRLVGFAAHGLGPATIAQRESKERFGLVKGLAGLTKRSNSVTEKVGPGCFVGGDTRASLEAMIRFPFGPMQLITFGAIGLLVNRTQLHGLADVSKNLRASFGAGVGYPLPGGGHIAATFTLPLQAVEGDLIRRFQVSLTFGNPL